MRDPQRLVDLAAEMDRPRELYLSWRRIAERYDRGKHTVLAEIMATHRANLEASGEKATVNQLEMLAYSDERYKKYLKEWDDAEKAMTQARVVFENLQCAFEALQSALAYDRDAMKKISGT